MPPSIVPVYFPFTFLSPRQGTRMAIWFPSVALFQPSESDLPPAMDTMKNTNLMDIRVPLKDNHDQFLTVCKAYRNWGQDAPEIKNRLQDKPPFTDEDRPTAIRNAVRRQGQVPDDQTGSDRLTARVFLQLAQDFDGAQWEAAGSLSTVDRMEKDMFSQMTGEDAATVRPSGEGPAFGIEDRGTRLTAERLAAWTTLLLQDTVDNPFFITDSMAVIDHLVEKTPAMTPIGTFAAPPDNGTAAGKAKIREDLHSRIDHLVHAAEPLAAGGEAPGHPEDNFSGVRLYVVPGQSPRHFFSNLTGRDQDSTPSHAGKPSSIRNTVIGYLSI